MFRFRGIPMPGFGLATLLGIGLLVTTPVNGLDGASLGLTTLACWLVFDLIAVSIILKDPSPTGPGSEPTQIVDDRGAGESAEPGSEPGSTSPQTGSPLT